MITTYRLSDVELAYARAGELHRIPTADHRDPETLTVSVATRGIVNNKVYNGPHKHLTRELLQGELAAGKTIDHIARDYQIPRGTMSGILARFGLSKPRKGQRYEG